MFLTYFVVTNIWHSRRAKTALSYVVSLLPGKWVLLNDPTEPQLAFYSATNRVTALKSTWNIHAQGTFVFIVRNWEMSGRKNNVLMKYIIFSLFFYSNV